MIAEVGNGKGKLVDRVIEACSGKHVMAGNHAQSFKVGRPGVDREVCGAVKSHVFHHMGAASLPIGFLQCSCVHHKSNLQVVLGVIIRQDDVA